MSLKYEPASEPLHISAKYTGLNAVQRRWRKAVHHGKVPRLTRKVDVRLPGKGNSGRFLPSQFWCAVCDPQGSGFMANQFGVVGVLCGPSRAVPDMEFGVWFGG